MCAVCLIKKSLFLFKSSKVLTSVVRSDKNSAYRVNADHGRDFNHMTKLHNFTKGKNHGFSAFRFSLYFMLE